MSTKNNIIHINGKKYDARSGSLIADVTPAKHPPVAPAHRAPHPKPTMHDVIRQSAKSGGRAKPQASRTLVRHAVQKPVPGHQRQLKAHSHTGSLVKQPAHALQTKSSVYQLNAKRLQHAKRVPQSQAIRHFGVIEPVMPSPAPRPHPVAHKPLPQPSRSKTHNGTNGTADLLERALRQAHSHQQPPVKPAKRGKLSRRITGLSAMVAAVAILLGVIVSQNLTNVRLQMASSKAGFDATLPDYKPSGYRLSHLTAKAGSVDIQFQSNSDNERAFAITEKASSWDSQTLRDSFVASTGQTYQTVETGGRTLYLYGQNATWVNSGVWYQVASHDALNSRELVQLATSL